MPCIAGDLICCPLKICDINSRRQLSRARSPKKCDTLSVSLWRSRHSETSAWLSAVLTSANLLLMFILQKLASGLSELEQMRVSQGALLKQVWKLSSERKFLC